MAPKRKIHEAFGRPNGHLSAVAAAKLARQSAQIRAQEEETLPSATSLAATIANAPYEGDEGAAIPSGNVSAEEANSLEQPATTSATRLSTFTRTHVNIVRDDDEYFEVLLMLNETIAFVGQYDLEVLSGIVTIYGSVVRPNSNIRRVFAPSTHALPLIHARQDNTRVRISSIKSGIAKLSKLSPLFRKIWAGAESDRSFIPIGTTDDDPFQRFLTAVNIEKDTDATLRTLSAKVSVERRKPRILAIGAKSSGKSTFNRILCNHLLSWTKTKKISYLDLDPGQPEFGPPGQISLVDVPAPILGPPFTHSAWTGSDEYRSIRTHTIAATSFKGDPDLYMAAALDMIRYVDDSSPLVVNSCGWINGLGATMLADLTSSLKITDIILLDPLDNSLVHSLQHSPNQPDLHHIPRQPPRPSPRTPAETRAMQTMSYMHHRPSPTKWSGKPLSTVRPWIVDYAGANQAITAIASYDQTPHPDYLAELLDGSLVALVVLEPNHAFLPPGADGGKEEGGAVIARTKHSLPYLTPTSTGTTRALDPNTSRCIGLALVRALDLDNTALHLLLPPSLSQTDLALLANKAPDLVLVRGTFDPPGWAYLEDVHADDGGGRVPLERPWVGSREKIGIEGAVWRLRHPPLSSSSSFSGGSTGGAGRTKGARGTSTEM